MDPYLAQVNISRQRIQARHEAGGCDCLLPREEECLFITPANKDGQLGLMKIGSRS